MTPALLCEGLTKTYGSGELAEPVLRQASLTLQAGESALLMGPSGSGKTTLLSILGCLLTPSHGTLSVGGRSVDFSLPSALSELRRQHIGFVFQHAQLLPFLTIEENLAVPGRNAGVMTVVEADRAERVVKELRTFKEGLGARASRSGGVKVFVLPVEMAA